MDKKTILFFVSIIFSLPMLSDNGNTSLGAQQDALAGSNLFTSNVWIAHNNPSLLGSFNTISAGIYFQNRFSMKQLGYKAVALTLPVKNAGFGLSYNAFGYSIFQESQLKLAYGMKLGEKVNTGISVSWLNTKVASDYAKNYNRFIPELALTYKVTRTLTISTLIFNPMLQKINNNTNERIPTIFKLGGLYQVSEKVKLTAQIDKDLDFDASIKVGLMYELNEKFNINTGISTSPTLAAFGFGYKLNNFTTSFAASFHQQLGISPSISIIYNRKK